MKSFYVKQVDSEAWAQKLSQAKVAGFLQSQLWAKYKAQIDGAAPYYLQVSDGYEDLLGLLLLEEKPGAPGLSLRQKLSRRLSVGKGGWLRWQDGPVVYTRDTQKLGGALSALLEWIDAFAAARGSHHIDAQPFRGLSEDVNVALASASMNHRYRSKIWATYLVDLSIPEEELWESLKSTGRKAVRKARKLGLFTQELLGEAGVERFIETYSAFERAAGRKVRPSQRLKTLWQLDRGEHYHFFLAFDAEGRSISALGMHTFNGVATEIASSTSQVAYQAKLPAQDLLHWDMFLAAQKLGCHTFDLAGISPDPQSSKERGIAQFKEKWGGVYKEYPILRKDFRKTFFDHLQARSIVSW